MNLFHFFRRIIDFGSAIDEFTLKHLYGSGPSRYKFILLNLTPSAVNLNFFSILSILLQLLCWSFPVKETPALLFLKKITIESCMYSYFVLDLFCCLVILFLDSVPIICVIQGHWRVREMIVARLETQYGYSNCTPWSAILRIPDILIFNKTLIIKWGKERTWRRNMRENSHNCIFKKS